jgi:hypothetical protein
VRLKHAEKNASKRKDVYEKNYKTIDHIVGYPGVAKNILQRQTQIAKNEKDTSVIIDKQTDLRMFKIMQQIDVQEKYPGQDKEIFAKLKKMRTKALDDIDKTI